MEEKEGGRESWMCRWMGIRREKGLHGWVMVGCGDERIKVAGCGYIEKVERMDG